MDASRANRTITVRVSDFDYIWRQQDEIEQGPHAYWHWYDFDFPRWLTFREKQYHYRAYQAGKRGRFLVDMARLIGVVHKRRDHLRCPDCGKSYFHEEPYMVIGRVGLRASSIWSILCPAHVLGRLAMWHVLELVKHDRREKRKGGRR